jgi:ABC-type uncharacterized transport system permease subunit
VSALWPNGAAYRQLAGMGMQFFFTYRGWLVIELVVILLRVFLLRMVWTAVYAGRDSVDGVELDVLVAYVTLASLQFWFLFPGLAELIAEQVREGKVAVELARPVPYLRQLLARQIGQTAALTPFLAAAVPFALVLGSLRPPASAAAGALYLVSLVLAWGIVTLIGLLLGLLAFWTVEIWGFVTIRYFVSQFFGGALVPLWFFPDWLRTVAGLLPFQGESFIPMSIYLGRLTGPEAARALGIQLFWVAALYALGGLLWRRTIRRLVIQGG